MKKSLFVSLIAIAALSAGSVRADDEGVPDRIIEIKASTRQERTRLANLGYALEDIRSDKVFVWGHEEDAQRIRDAGFNATSVALPARIMAERERVETRYHSYDSMTKALQQLEKDHSSIVTLMSLGRSVQNRDIPMVRISGKSVGQAEANKVPVMFYMGCHHAREHLSVEVPLMLAQYLVSEYGNNPDVTRLVDTREIYIAPMVNPDGHAFDFTGQRRGKMWRKNRSQNADGSFGVDLNRNYGFAWGTGGSSKNPQSDVYMGSEPFSEPETRAVRDFVRTQPRMTTLLTLHTFSELVLYPWGHTEDRVGQNGKGTPEDYAVFKKMAEEMAQWNHYTPEQASDLYIASGDTTDWAYGERGIIAFTFELTPNSMQGGGFYPGDGAIDPTFAENLKPMLYLLDYADNPRRVLQTARRPSFLETPARRGVAIADFRDSL